MMNNLSYRCEKYELRSEIRTMFLNKLTIR